MIFSILWRGAFVAIRQACGGTAMGYNLLRRNIKDHLSCTRA